MLPTFLLQRLTRPTSATLTGPGNARYPASYATPPPKGRRYTGSVSCCLSATGICFLSHPVPDGQHQRSSRSAYRTTGPDPVGVSTFHMRKTRPVRVPLLPRGGGVHAIGQMRPTATCCFPAASPAPRHHIHLSEAHLDEVSTAIHSRSPIRSSPHLRFLDGTTTAWAFPRASHPAVTSNACRGGDRHRTHARDHVIDNIADPSFQRVHLLHATSCRTTYEMPLFLAVNGF